MSEVGKSVGETTPEKAELAGDLDVRIAQELIEQARAEGVSLVGEGGLLQKAGFAITGTAISFANGRNTEIEETILRLDEPANTVPVVTRSAWAASTRLRDLTLACAVGPARSRRLSKLSAGPTGPVAVNAVSAAEVCEHRQDPPVAVRLRW